MCGLLVNKTNLKSETMFLPFENSLIRTINRSSAHETASVSAEHPLQPLTGAVTGNVLKYTNNYFGIYWLGDVTNCYFAVCQMYL